MPSAYVTRIPVRTKSRIDGKEERRSATREMDGEHDHRHTSQKRRRRRRSAPSSHEHVRRTDDEDARVSRRPSNYEHEPGDETSDEESSDEELSRRSSIISEESRYGEAETTKPRSGHRHRRRHRHSKHRSKHSGERAKHSRESSRGDNLGTGDVTGGNSERSRSESDAGLNGTGNDSLQLPQVKGTAQRYDPKLFLSCGKHSDLILRRSSSITISSNATRSQPRRSSTSATFDKFISSHTSSNSSTRPRRRPSGANKAEPSTSARKRPSRPGGIFADWFKFAAPISEKRPVKMFVVVVLPKFSSSLRE